MTAHLSPAELRELFLFADLDDDKLGWVAGHGDVVEYAAGSVVSAEGAPAECFWVLLDGTMTMSRYLIDQIATIPIITVRTCTTVEAAYGDGHLERLTLRDAVTGETQNVAANHLFVFIGAAPRTDWLDGVVVRDARGFIPTGPELLLDGRRPAGWSLDRDPYFLESSLPGVFVAGDVRAQSVKRVASAVGEGAMAVTLVHRYLEER